MSIDHRHASASLRSVLLSRSPELLARQLAPKSGGDPLPELPRDSASADGAMRRWDTLPHAEGIDGARAELLDGSAADRAEQFARNVENFIGTVKVPVGIAGPLRVNGVHAQGLYWVPLATTEAALVASYSRGARLVSEAGGCTAVTINEGVSRAPGFAFRNIYEAGQFVAWAVANLSALRAVAESTSRYARLQDMRVSLEGNHVYLIFDYSTGDAAGQNMVTIATQAVCEHIARECPMQAQYSFVEANHSGDKKASAQSFMSVRGKSVTAEVVIPADLLKRRLHTSPKMMSNYWHMSAVGGVLSGTIGVQGHYANGIAALYLATGQDVACVAESAVGVTRFELAEDALYAAVTLPNLIVGTVGGGTVLPSQRACLDIMGLRGEGHSKALAEVCAGLALAGELSIVGAIVAGEFTSAHERLARGVQSPRRSPSSHDSARSSPEEPAR